MSEFAPITAKDAKERKGREDIEDIGRAILGCAVTVHKALGPGLLESAYETCLAHELGKARLSCQRQVAIPIVYDGLKIDAGYRLDLLVDQRIVVEIKSVERLGDVHQAQLLSYPRLGNYRLGYLLNFNVAKLKDGIWRLVNQL